MDLSKELQDDLFKSLSRAYWYKDSIKACCPYHDEKTPSFTISQNNEGYWYFYCFGCLEKGTLNKLFYTLKLPYKLTYPKFSGRLKEKDKSVLPTRLDTTRGLPDYYDYFNSRGISNEVCQKFKFKFDVLRERAVFPVYVGTRYVGYINRHIYGSVRYEIQSHLPISRIIWAVDHINPDEPVYITEGIIDAAIFWTVGCQGLALCNKTWKDKVDLIKHIPSRNLIYIPDNYDPQSTQIFKDMRGELGGKIEYIPLPYKDAGDYIRKIPYK